MIDQKDAMEIPSNIFYDGVGGIEMNKMILPKLLLKFTDELEFASKLVDSGELYMSSPKSFDSLDDDGRSDWREPVTHILQGRKLRQEGSVVLSYVDGKEVNMLDWGIENLYLRRDDKKEYRIYSLLGLKELDEEFDSISDNFGNFLTVITDPIEFIKRIDKAIGVINTSRNEENKMFFYAGWTGYFDEHEYHGIWTPFHKPIGYENQKEYRIAIMDPLINDELKKPFYIGNISDIAQYGTCEELLLLD